MHKCAVAFVAILGFAIGCSSSSPVAHVESFKSNCANTNGGCECGGTKQELEFAGSPTQACSVSSLGGGAGVCCAQSGYATAGDGLCQCTTFACVPSVAPGGGNSCVCGAGQSASDSTSACTATQSSSPLVGGAVDVCCLAAPAASCFCGVSQDTCETEGGSVVPQCTVAMLDTSCATSFPVGGFSVAASDCRGF